MARIIFKYVLLLWKRPDVTVASALLSSVVLAALVRIDLVFFFIQDSEVATIGISPHRRHS